MYVKVIRSELGPSAVPPYHMLLGCAHRINNREQKLEREMLQKGQCPELLHIQYYYYNHHSWSVSHSVSHLLHKTKSAELEKKCT